MRAMTAEELHGRKELFAKVNALQESGTCPTCRDLEFKDVYPPFEDRVFLADKIVVCFLEMYPRNPGHTIVLVRLHCDDFTEVPKDIGCHVLKICQAAARSLKEVLGAEKVYLNTMCDGKRNHLHFQLIPRLRGDTIRGLRLFVKERGIWTDRPDVVRELA